MAPEAGPLDRVLWRILADLLDSPSGPLKCKGAMRPEQGKLSSADDQIIRLFFADPFRSILDKRMRWPPLSGRMSGLRF